MLEPGKDHLITPEDWKEIYLAPNDPSSADLAAVANL
jgi:hypothetical protein